MMNFLFTPVMELTKTKKPYMFNLFEPSSRNAHLVAIGNSGHGKAHLFRKLLEQEHKQYSSITSFILSQHGHEEYQGIGDSVESKNVHRVEDYTINPFDCCYLDEEHTIQKVSKLLHTIGLSMFIEWSESHDKLTREYIELLLNKYKEEQSIPTIHDLFVIVKANTINCTKQRDLIVLLDINAILDLFESDSLPLKRMFNGMTEIPYYDEKQVVHIEGGGVLNEYLAPYTSLLIEHLYLLQRYSLQESNNHKVAFYQDGFLSFLDDPCYSFLTNFVMRCESSKYLGVRLSAHIFGEVELLKKHPILQASNHYMDVEEGFYLNEDKKGIFLDDNYCVE